MKGVIIVVSHPGTVRTLLGYQRAVLSQTYQVSMGRQATDATERVSATREQRAQVDSSGEGGNVRPRKEL